MTYFLSQTLFSAKERPITCTLEQLLSEYGFTSSSLEGVSVLKETLECYDLEMDPEIGDYDLKCQRTLKPIRGKSQIERIIDEILEAGGENYRVELKSSVSIDVNKMENVPGLKLKDYVSDKLKAKVAQEISAFLNRDGGTILFGVSNNLEILGCENDIASFSGDGTPQDKSDLLIRQLIEKHFHKPEIVLSHLQIECELYKDKYVIMLSIASMESIAFLKCSAEIKHSLCRRIGTSAQSIPAHEIETHYKLTPKS